MLVRKRLIFPMTFTMVAAVVLGGNSRLDVSKFTVHLHGPSPAAGRSLNTFQRGSEFLPTQFLPLQFKSPSDLGIGKLLVASRSLRDPNFARTVVLLIHYDDDGVVGLILNRRTAVPISRVLDLKGAKDRADPVYVGGPVELSNVHALLQSSTRIEKAENIFGGVYLISDKNLFEQAISARPDPGVFHVYLGYAGWKPDQLRSEMKLGAWFAFPADSSAVFDLDPDSLWLQMIQRTELRLAKNEHLAAPSPPRLVGGSSHFVENFLSSPL